MKELTLEDFERFVRNRPLPDTPGFYKLWRLRSGATGYTRHDIDYHDAVDNETVKGSVWRFPVRPSCDMEYEYHPTFEDAYRSMTTPSRIDNEIVCCGSGPEHIIGYRICRLGFGPHGTRDFYIEYSNYDGMFREYDRSSCSSYHWNTPGIYGKYLGRFPEQIAFRQGDIVETCMSRFEDGGMEYSALGVVVGIPWTVEEVWERIRDDVNSLDCNNRLEAYFEAPDHGGVDVEEYFILYGPVNESLTYATFRHPSEVRPPSFDVPAEAVETLRRYYDRYMETLL